MYLTTEDKRKNFRKTRNFKNRHWFCRRSNCFILRTVSTIVTEHLKSNRKDYNTERSLVKLVGKAQKSY